MTIKEKIGKAKFGEMFNTTTGKRAIFLRYANNAENRFAIFYVEDWGQVQVFANTVREVHGDVEHSII